MDDKGDGDGDDGKKVRGELIEDNTGPPPPPPVAVATHEETAASSSEEHPKKKQQGRVEEIHDEEGPSPCWTSSLLNEKSDVSKEIYGMPARKGRVELIEDAIGPPPPVATLEETAASSSEEHPKKKQQGRVEEIHDEEGPSPTPASLLNEKSDVSKEIYRKPAPQSQLIVDNISESTELPSTNSGIQIIRPNSTSEGENSPHAMHGDNDLDRGRIVPNYENNRVNMSPPMDQEQNEEPVLIPNAYLVVEESGEDSDDDNNEEHEIVAAERLILWWKQNRTRFLLIVVFSLATTTAVTLGVYFSLKDPDPIIIVGSSPPSVSFTPTLSPSGVPSIAPSSSQIPTQAPTTNFELRIRNKQAAIEGNNTLTVTRISPGYLTITFYLRTDDGPVQVGDFTEKDYGRDYIVALDGYTAHINIFGACGDGVWAVDDWSEQVFYAQDIGSLSWSKTTTRLLCPDDDYYSGGASKVISIHAIWAIAGLFVIQYLLSL